MKDTKCTYSLRWTKDPWLGTKAKCHDGKTRYLKRLWNKSAGIAIIELPDGSWEIRMSRDRKIAVSSKGEAGLREAKRTALQQDWASVVRNPISKSGAGRWTAAGGRIEVVKMTAPELTRALPSSHVAGAPGYAIYVDGVFTDCEFTLRDVQHLIGAAGRREAPYLLSEGAS